MSYHSGAQRRTQTRLTECAGQSWRLYLVLGTVSSLVSRHFSAAC
jgi:hypothetical protein